MVRPPCGGTTLARRTMERASVGHTDTQFPHPMQWAELTRITLVNHAQRLHGTSLHAVTAPCAGPLIDRQFEIGVGQSPNHPEFFDHLQELTAAPTTVAHKYEITGEIVCVVHQPGLLRGLQNLVALLLGNPLPEFSLDNEVRYIAEGQAGITGYVLDLAFIVDQEGVVAAITDGSGKGVGLFNQFRQLLKGIDLTAWGQFLLHRNRPGGRVRHHFLHEFRILHHR